MRRLFAKNVRIVRKSSELTKSLAKANVLDYLEAESTQA